jgi:hypothetical protein
MRVTIEEAKRMWCPKRSDETYRQPFEIECCLADRCMMFTEDGDEYREGTSTTRLYRCGYVARG